MVNSPVIEGATEWLSPRDACRLLQVSEVALRQWAAAGHLRVYRTPGGHRRFLRADLLALTGPAAVSPPPAPPPAPTPDKSENAALRRIRRRLSHAEVAGQSWYQSLAEGGRDRMRLFGRRLLSLLLQEPPPRKASGRWQETLAEARLLGREYGSEMAARGVAMPEAVAAFTFFRALAFDAANARAWPTLLELTDRALLGLVEAHQEISGRDAGAAIPAQAGNSPVSNAIPSSVNNPVPSPGDDSVLSPANDSPANQNGG